MKKIVYVFVSLFFYSGIIFSQSLSILEVDPSNFPNVKASFYAFDADGRLIKDLKKEDFSVVEDSMNREITFLSCPDFSQPDALSSVLIIDNSSSMRNYRLRLAKTAAKAWVNALPDGNSECAISIFNDNSSILSDFTTDRNKLISAINSLYYTGNTNYDAALLNIPAGGIQIAKKGKYKKVIVFLTDGQPNFSPDRETIIQEALANDIIIYCVTLYMPAPDCIKQFAERTGGEWFENVTTIEEAEEIYRKILQKVLLNDPCEIEWISDPGCNVTVRNANISDTIRLLYAEKKYIIPTQSRAFLKVVPASCRFTEFTPGITSDTTIKLFAIKSDYNEIEVSGTTSAFEITPQKFSLKSGDSIELNLSYYSADSLFNYDKIEFLSEFCSSELFVSGGDFTSFGNENTIKVIHPNGEEVFLVGLDTMITWEGVTPDDTVKIEYSYDNGANWSTISEKGAGLKHYWDTIPNTASNKCIMRVRKISGNSFYSVIGFGFINDMRYSPDGSKLALASSTGYVFILNPETGDIIESFQAHNVLNNISKSGVSSISFSPDGIKLASSGYDGKMKLWDLEMGKMDLEISAGYSVSSVCFNQDGTLLASGGGGKLVHIWSTDTGDSVKSFEAHKNGSNVVMFSTGGSKLASGGNDGKIMVWDLDSAGNDFVFSGHSNVIYCLDFSPDSTKMISGSADRTIKIWDLTTNKLKKTLYNYSYVYSAKFSPDGTKIINAGSDKILNIWDSENGDKLNSYPEENYYSVDVSPDGIAVACAERNSITIKKIETGIDSLIFSRGHRGTINFMGMSSDNKTIATAGSDTTIKIWDTDSKKVIRTIHTENRILSFGMDNKSIYVAALLRISSSEYLLNVWESSTGNIVQSLQDSDAVWSTIAVSPDGSALACGYKEGGRVDLINLKYGNLIKSLTDYDKRDSIESISFSSDGKKIIASTKSKIFTWDVLGGKFIGVIQANSTYSTFSPDGKTFATIGQGVSVWNSFTAQIINEIQTNDYISSLCYSPDGSWIATASRGTAWNKTTNVKLWEGKTGYIVESLPNYLNNLNCTKFFPDGTKAAFGTDDGSIMVWHLNSLTKLTDNSDTTWSIVIPDPKSRDVVMGDVIVGQSKDSLVSAFIYNDGTYPVSVESVTFSGADSSDFRLVSGFPPFIIPPDDSMAVEFRFVPSLKGSKWSWIKIKAKSRMLSQRIFGRGIDQGIELLNDNIDFGKVRIGDSKDSTVISVIKNIGDIPVDFTNSYHYKPNDLDFSTVSGGAPFTLDTGEEVEVTLKFKPGFRGRTSGNLVFEFDGPNSPLYVQLFGEGYELVPSILASTPEEIHLICENEFLDTLTITNTGDAELNISDIFFNNNKFEILSNSEDIDIEPGSSFLLRYIYSTDFPGTETADLTILSNAEPDSVLVLNYNASKDSVSFQFSENIIDLGYLCPGEVKDTTVTILNSGTLINTASVTLPTDYLIPEQNITLEPDSNRVLTISFLGKQNEGDFNEHLTFIDSICGRVYPVELKGIVRLPAIEAEDVVLTTTVGSYTDGTIEIDNTSDYELVINEEPQITDNQFRFINPLFPLSIPAQSRAVLDIRYEPVDSIASQITLTFVGEPCNVIEELSVAGSPVAASVELAADTIEGRTGEIVELPIYLNNPRNVEIAGATGYNLDLIFNYTLLDPLDYPDAPVVDGMRIISLDLPRDPDSDNIIATIRCKVCLGNASETELQIANYKSKDGIVAIRKYDGRFILKDVCDEGGKRLINPEGKAEILLAAPNPASDVLEIVYELIEYGYTEIYLTNSIGDKVITFYECDNTDIGRSTIKGNISGLSTGLYFIILNTPTLSKTEKILIVK
ncbi:choice-of-anchor D domain-containing protein [Bacteroidota bacterium]